MSEEKEKYAALARKLMERTSNGSLHWRIDPWTSKLTTDLAGYSIRLEREESPEGEPLVIVSIYKGASEDDYVDGFSDAEMGDVATGFAEYPSFWRLLDKLQKIAYRNAKGADEALDKILGELDDDAVPF